MDIKQFILNNLFTKNGVINAAITRRERFLQSTEYRLICSLTSFLKLNATISNRIWCILHDIVESPKCIICDENATFLPNKGAGYAKTCSKPSCKTKASTDIRHATMISKYGSKVSDNVRIKARERIGELNRKSRETIIKKYGVINPIQIDGKLKQRKETNIKKYGTEYYIQSDEYKEIISINRKKRLQELTDIVQINEIILPQKEKIENFDNALFEVRFNCTICDSNEILNSGTFKWRIKNFNNACTKCTGIEHDSYIQNEIFDYIKNYTSDAIINDKTILFEKNLELDIFIPSKKLAFEIDGIYWHSYDKKETWQEKSYHRWKQELCESRGIKLIRILETEWNNYNNITKSKIINLINSDLNTKIYARNCQIKELSFSEYKNFFDDNHIQGNVPARHAIGLIYNNELVFAISFINPRFNKNYEIELLRICSKLNTNIVGGLSKTFNYIVKKFKPKNILSYSDLRWGNGSSMKNLNFKFSGNTKPNYYWVKSDKLYSRYQFQKHKLEDRLDKYDPLLSESENMFNNGYRRLWDCGNAKWVWESL